jgi:hypothetical protein
VDIRSRPFAILEQRLLMRRVLILTVLLLVLPTAGCGFGNGGHDKKNTNLPAVKDLSPEDPNFHVNGEAGPYAGGAPLKVQFAAKAYRGSGDVRWYWRFDDGMSSTEQNPTHTFAKPGYYQVVVDAIDGKKHTNFRSLYMGVWPADVWRRRAKLTDAESAVEVVKQQRRTRKRKHQLREDCLKAPACKRQLQPPKPVSPKNQ